MIFSSKTVAAISSKFSIAFVSTGFHTIFLKTIAATFIVSLLSKDSFSHGQELVDSYTGRDSNDKFGWDVAISGDRSIIAAGAPYGNNAGYVMIFSKLDTDWGVLQQINGTNANENFGSSIGLSYDGSILSIVSEGSKVGFYELSSSKTFYDLLDSRNFNGAGNVAVSPNGKVAGITSNTGNGRARIFERSNNDRFLPKGQITNALGFEGGISLNYDGSIFIIGDISSSSVRVYQYNNNRWDVKGNEITDDSGFDDFGCCVSITHDGLTVAIGAPGNYENEGLVRVHYYNETEQTWIVSGDDLLGDNNGDGFSRNSLSATGKYLVVGTYAGNYVKIFERNGVNYQPLGEKLTQESESFGWSVDISADGSAVVVGSPTFSDDKGKGYLFLSDISQSTPSPSVSPSLVPTTTASEILNPSDIPQATPSPSVSSSLVPTTTASEIQNPSDMSNPSPSVSSSLVPTTTASEIQNPSDILQATPSLIPTIQNPSDVPQATPSPSVSSSLVPTTTASEIQNPSDISTPSPSVSSSLVPTTTASEIENPSDISTPSPSVFLSLVPTTTASEILNPSDIPQATPSLISTIQNPSDIPQATPSPSVSSSLVPTTTASEIQNPSDIPQTTLFPSVSSSLIPTTTASKIQHTDIPQATPSSSVSSSLVPTATSSKIQNPSNIPQTALFPSVSSSLVPTTTASKIQNADILQVRPPTPSVSTTLVPTTTASKIRFDLTFVGEETVVDFSGDSPADEIVMKTLVSKNDQRDSFQQKIMIGAECQYNLSFEYPDIIPPVTVSNDQSLDEDWRGDTIKVTTKIDIDTENIVTNGIHSSDPNNKSIYSEYLDPTDGRLKAKITFCVRTDYGRIDIIGGTGESSITFYKVKVTINFPLEYGFSSADVSIEEEEESNVEQVGTITANLEACACPADAVSKTNCTDSTSYDQNDILNVCVYDPNNNAIITAFKDVSLGNGEISTQVVDSTGNPSALASVNKLNEEMAMINTRIVSAFFDVVDESTGSPMPVTVAGTAVIGFKTVNRKIIAISTRGVKNMRKLQDNSDTDVVRGEGSFDIKVLLSDGGQLDGSPGPAQVSEYGKMLFVTLMMISTSLSGLLE